MPPTRTRRKSCTGNRVQSKKARNNHFPNTANKVTPGEALMGGRLPAPELFEFHDFERSRKLRKRDLFQNNAGKIVAGGEEVGIAAKKDLQFPNHGLFKEHLETPSASVINAEDANRMKLEENRPEKDKAHAKEKNSAKTKGTGDNKKVEISRDLKEKAKELFEEIIDTQVLYSQQFLVILVNSKKKRGKPNFQCLLDAEEVLVIQRNPEGQVYFANNLHKNVHFVANSKILQKLKNICKNVKIVKNSEDLLTSADFFVWNRKQKNDGVDTRVFTDTDQSIESYFQEMADTIKVLVPVLNKINMSPPGKSDRRGTMAMNLGFNVTDCTKYKSYRTTILSTIRPFLITKVSSEEAEKIMHQTEFDLRNVGSTGSRMQKIKTCSGEGCGDGLSEVDA